MDHIPVWMKVGFGGSWVLISAVLLISGARDLFRRERGAWSEILIALAIGLSAVFIFTI